MKVSFGYSDSDDRMWLRAGETGPLWWITRRLALKLVTRWAEILERSFAESATGEDDGDALESHSAAASASLLAEHRSALDAPPPDAPEASDATSPAPPGAGMLVYSVTLGTRGDRIRLMLHSSGQRQALESGREDSHRLLAAFVSRCRRNGWLETHLPAWLDSEPR